LTCAATARRICVGEQQPSKAQCLCSFADKERKEGTSKEKKEEKKDQQEVKEEIKETKSDDATRTGKIC